MHFWFLLQDRGKSSQIVPKDATRATGVGGIGGDSRQQSYSLVVPACYTTKLPGKIYSVAHYLHDCYGVNQPLPTGFEVHFMKETLYPAV